MALQLFLRGVFREEEFQQTQDLGPDLRMVLGVLRRLCEHRLLLKVEDVRVPHDGHLHQDRHAHRGL